MRSEIGILFLNDFNEKVLTKLLKAQELEFHLLFVARPHVFISRNHPLAQQTVITNEELEEYPYLSFEQGEHNSFYFSEEILFGIGAEEKHPRARPCHAVQPSDRPERIYRVQRRDRRKPDGKDIIAVPLADESEMRIGTSHIKKEDAAALALRTWNV